ncbi:MAG: hypothetical protein J6T57_01810 [Alphaproteobacteria bacterium]|nr:hypothetical protein [Alphaproteobacteria bacterium]
MYKKIFIGILFCIVSITISRANVIDVFSTGDGYYQIVSDGEIVGNLNKAGADKVIEQYRATGNTINSTTANPKVGKFGATPKTATGGGFGGTGGGGGGGTTTASANSQALVPQPKTTTAVTKYDPNIAKTSTTSTSSATTATKSIGPAGNPGGTTAPKQLGPGTTTPKPTPPAGGGGGAGGNAGGTAAKAAGSTVGKALGTGLAVVGGVVSAVDFADNAKAKERKTTWGDVARSAADGAGMAMGTAAIINVIPVGGQIAYGAAIAVGAVAGAIHTARKIFSETDCEYDPVFGTYNCCHTSKAMSNIKARNVDIGGEMFCDFPYIRKCVQGRKEHESDQGFRGLFLNDHWSRECRIKYCPGYEEPKDSAGNYEITTAGQYLNDGTVCWYWICPEGMTRDGSKCIPDGNSNDQNSTPGDAPSNAKSCKTDADCVGAKLPQYATAGRCIQKNKNERVCAATACQPGTYLVKKNGRSMGWCRAGTEPNENENQVPPQQNEPDPNQNVVPPVLILPKPNVCSDPNNMDENCNCKPAFTSVGADGKCVCDDSNARLVGGICSCRHIADAEFKDGKCVCNDSNKEIRNQKCDYTEEYVNEQKRQELIKGIEATAEKLSATMGGFEKSVWKDAEGNFNTARLASDSIAGVVLGTAGGIITSKLVKKNQLKKGFEDIQCYIGGQSVAGYGDDFVVGK